MGVIPGTTVEWEFSIVLSCYSSLVLFDIAGGGGMIMRAVETSLHAW